MKQLNIRGIIFLSYVVCIWGLFGQESIKTKDLESVKEEKIHAFIDFLVFEGYQHDHAQKKIDQVLAEKCDSLPEFKNLFSVNDAEKGFILWKEIRALIPYKISVNSADAEELCMLPGVGRILARRIIEFREKQKILSSEDLLMIKGIGESKLSKIKDLVTFKVKEENNEQ